MRKRKQIRRSVFQRNYHGNGISVSGNMELYVFFYVFCKAQSNNSKNLINTFRPNQEYQKRPPLASLKGRPRLGCMYTHISSPSTSFPISSSPIHCCTTVRTIPYCCLREKPAYIQHRVQTFNGSFGSGKYPLYVPCPLRMQSIFVSGNICFCICFQGFRIRFHFRKKYKNKCGATEFRLYPLRFHP